jgi:lipid-A-disaccharide synthase-like uncharacterized protein
MHEVIFSIPLNGSTWSITLWKLIGYTGVVLFAGRWIVQVIASGRKGAVTMPRSFWLMSLLGSVLLLAYFTFGKNDSVGILSNLMPSAIASYNLFLDFREGRRSKRARQAPTA